MIQLRYPSIVKENLILMAQAKKTQLSFGYSVGSHGKGVSYGILTHNSRQLSTGELTKFFINSTTGGIS